MTEITAELHNWEYDERGIYWGRIHGDTKKRWKDGTHIHTSLVTRIDRDSDPDAAIVYTLNSVYRLPRDAKKAET